MAEEDVSAAALRGMADRGFFNESDMMKSDVRLQYPIAI